MALTINPAVSGTYQRYSVHAALFTMSVFAGVLVTALAIMLLVAGIIAVTSVQVGVAVAVTVTAWAVAHDLGAPIWLPYRRGQVPEWFRSAFSPGVVAVLFGFQLGAGFLTFFTYSVQLAMLMAIPFLASFAQVAAVAGLFALGKSVVLLLALGIDSVGDITPRFNATTGRLRILKLTSATASVVVAIAMIISV